MEYSRWGVACGLVALSLSGCALKPETIAERVKPGVVLINYQFTRGNGTGFFVPGEPGVCTVLTARHVVASSQNLQVQTEDGIFHKMAIYSQRLLGVQSSPKVDTIFSQGFLPLSWRYITV
ncbi:MAG: serine protease [Oscillatoria sp. Prado101]|jgi:hypothetical protein|nr:serine protease [Oscillatoria sp. Prado101]